MCPIHSRKLLHLVRLFEAYVLTTMSHKRQSPRQRRQRGSHRQLASWPEVFRVTEELPPSPTLDINAIGPLSSSGIIIVRAAGKQAIESFKMKRPTSGMSAWPARHRTPRFFAVRTSRQHSDPAERIRCAPFLDREQGIRNGRAMTFVSRGLYTRPSASASAEIALRLRLSRRRKSRCNGRR